MRELTLLEWQLIPEKMKKWTMQGSQGFKLYSWLEINGEIHEVIIKELRDQGYYEVI